MTNATKLSYEPPAANIWSIEELNSIEAEMSYGDDSWIVPSHPDGSSSSPISLELDGSYHSGYSRVCWLKFTTKGSYDIKCSTNGAGIRIYDNFNGSPTASPAHYGNGSLFETYGCIGAITQYVCIKSDDSSTAWHSCGVQQHVDRHYFDNNALGAYWSPQGDYSANREITPCRVIYLPEKTVDAIYRLIEDNPDYGNARNFYSCVDTAIDKAADWAKQIGFQRLSYVVTGLRLLVLFNTPESAQQVIDRIRKNSSQYANGIRAEETINGFNPICECESWNSSSIMTGIPGSIGDWHYFKEEDLQ